MYGVLYAVSPELFPTRGRGTGNAIVASANRIFGIMVSLSFISDHCFTHFHANDRPKAPIIALYANLATSAPIYVSGALFIVAGVIALGLPFEPRGKASM